MFSSKIIYIINDSAFILVRGLSLFTGENYLPPGSVGYGPGILSNIFVNSFFRVFHPVFAANAITILYFVINTVVSFLFFRTLSKNKSLSTVFSLFYSLSLYFLFRVMSFTTGLYPVFVFPLILLLLTKNKKPYIVGGLIFLCFSISSYYGFFGFVLALLWYLYRGIVEKENFCNKAGRLLKNISLFLLPVALGLVVVYWQILAQSLPIFGSYKKHTQEERLSGVRRVYRAEEDFYNFSFRPWYFVIPPESSTFFGEFSDRILKDIENSNYYLADDYAAEEMAGSYMGWHFLFGAGLVLFLLMLDLFRGKRWGYFDNVYRNRGLIGFCFFSMVAILLISFPPSFTISGVEIYTPSYLIYRLVPVFRVLVRWSVVLYLLLLIVNLFLVSDFISSIKAKWGKVGFIGFVVGLTVAIFSVRLPVIDINSFSDEIGFLSNVSRDQVSYAVYPSGDYYSVFWILAHENYLINPPDYINAKGNFSSLEFSSNLDTLEGVEAFRNLGGEYVVVYKDRITGDEVDKATEFFARNIGPCVYDSVSAAVFRDLLSGKID